MLCREFGFTLGMAVMAVFVFSSCNQKPESVVKKYLDRTFLDNNGTRAYELLCQEDKTYMSREDFSREVRKKNVLSKKVLEKYEDYFSYEIISSEDKGDTVYVTAQLNRPNAVNVLSDLVSYAMLTPFSSLSPEEQMEAIRQKFDAIMMSKDRLMVTNEHIFKVLKEDKGYRLFLNLGYLEKQKRVQALVNKLLIQAHEYERTANYDKALQYYERAFDLKRDTEIRERIEKLTNIRESMLSLGHGRRLGNLYFTPLKVEQRPAWLKKFDGSDFFEITSEEWLIFTYEVKNISEGEVFAIEDEFLYKTESLVVDNFGNKMRELRPDAFTREIEGKRWCRLKPGEVRVFKTACEAPLSDSASKFIWKINLITNNNNREEMAYLSFSRSDIEHTGFLAKF